MKILALNQDWLKPELEELGHEVISLGFNRHLDVVLGSPVRHIQALIKELPQGFEPQVIIGWDNSAPFSVVGLDETDVPTLFYAVDTHHHIELHRYLYNLFDYTLVAQRDYIDKFAEVSNHPGWMPLWSSRYVEPAPLKTHGAVFVGTLDAKLNPDRVNFFETLKERVPILITSGAWWDIFAGAEIVVNQTVKGDLNFRVFEAMMSGALLLTERGPNGLLELFEDGKHLITYAKGNVKEAEEKIRYYLEHKEEARLIAAAGREEVLKNHTAKARAKQVHEIITTLKKRPDSRRHFAAAANFSSLADRLRKLDTALTKQALVSAMRSAEFGRAARNSLDTGLACYLVAAAMRYDEYLSSDMGEKFVHALGASYPEAEVVALVRIRYLLNAGKQAEARALARSINLDDMTRIYQAADDIVRSLMVVEERS